METRLTPEQQQIREMCREFAAKELTPNAKKWDEEHHFPKEAVKKLGELGLLGIAVPMVLIGAGQGLAFGPLTASGIARVDAAHAGAASGVVNSVHQLGGALGMSLVLAISSSYPGAMRAGGVLLAAALAAAVLLVLPAARARRAG